MNPDLAQDSPPQQTHTDPGMPVPNPGEYGGNANSRQDGAAAPDVDEWMRHMDENAQLWAAQARESIREHPLGTVAAAVVAGLLLARLMR